MSGKLQRLLGANLRAYRRRRGFTQSELGELIGYNRTFIGGLERGERNVTLRTVERLAERLEVAPLDLLVDSNHTKR